MRVLLFLVAGLATAAIDNGIFWLLNRATDLVLLPLAAATAVSVTFNYLVVGRFVFTSNIDHRSALPKYLGVHFTGILIRYGIIRVILSKVQIPVVAAKLVTDGIVYSLKYFVQRDFVFKSATGSATTEPDRSVAPEPIQQTPIRESESLP